MNLKFALKAGCAAVALAAASGAFASPYYIDVGTAFPGAGARVTPTSTGVKNQFGIAYESRTTVFDVDANGVDTGDFISTIAGLAIPGALFSNNLIDALQPAASLASSNNGYGFGNWEIGFRATGLTGIITGFAGPVPLLGYGPGGVIELLVSFDGGVTVNNFMDINVSGGGSSGGGTVLFGAVDFTNTDNAITDALGNPTGDIDLFRKMFHSTTASCLGDSSYFGLTTTCAPLQVSFVSSFDTDVLLSQFTAIAPGVFQVTSNHDGSGRFDVPEPGTVALLGLALAGLGFSQRRKSAAK